MGASNDGGPTGGATEGRRPRRSVASLADSAGVGRSGPHHCGVPTPGVAGGPPLPGGQDSAGT